MKKYGKGLALAALTFLFSLTPALAKEMTLDELGKEIQRVNPYPGYAYVVGEYAFTSTHTLTTQDLMLAAKTIKTTAADKYTDQDPIYGKMTIHTLIPTYSPDTGELQNWSVGTNYLGDTTLDLSGSKKINISYIDYQFVKEDTKMSVSVDDVDDTYKNKLNAKYGFNGNAENSEELSIDAETNKLTGLLFKNTQVKNIAGSDKTDYYFAFKINVPNIKNETTIVVKQGTKNLIDTTYEEFESELKTTDSVVLLVPVKSDATDKKITVTVDLDGDAEIYREASYELDWSDLEFQEDSKAKFALTIPELDKTDLKNWGYIVPADDYKFADESTDKNLKLTGKIIQQHTNPKVFSDEGEDGYYFAFNITPEKVLEGLKVTIQGKLTKIFTATDFGSGNMTHLFKLDENCKKGEDKSACKLDITVDLDGDGKEYIATKYTIEYGDVIFEKKTKGIVKGIDETSESQLETNYGWTKEADYAPVFEATNDNVKVTGFIPIVDKLTKDNVFGKDHLTGYYLAYVLQFEEAATDSTTIKFIKHGSDEEKIITGASSFDKDKKELYILRHLHPDDSNKTFEIEIDMDGSGEEYAPTKITIDWTELVLEKNSELEKASLATQDNISDEDYGDFTSWNFDFSKNDLTIHPLTPTAENDAGYKLAGTVREQKEVTAFSGETKSGYYVPIAIKVPVEHASKATFKLLSTKNGDAWVDVPSTEIHENTLAVLFAVYSDALSKKISFQFDLDGDGTEYRPVTYNIDYDGLTFVASHNVIFNYNDGVHESKTVSIYEDESLTKPQEEPTKKYHTFKHWSEDGKTEYTFGEVVQEDLTLLPRWDIDTDEYVNGAITAINASEDFTKDIVVEKIIDNANITIDVQKPNVNSTVLTNTILQELLKDVFGKKEITEITVKYGEENTVELTSANTASEQIQTLLKKIITNKDIITLDDIINKNNSLEISITKKVDAVEITDQTYTISFKADYRVVDDNIENLRAAINNKDVKVIYLSKSLTLKEMLDISMTDTVHSVTIQPLNSESITITGSNDYVMAIGSSNITFKNVKIKGAKTGILVKSGAVVTLENVDLSDNTEAGVEVKEGGSLTASKLTYNNETYDHPAVKADKGNAKVALTNNKEVVASSVEKEKIIKYEDNIKDAISGDTKQKDTEYQYYNYYNKEENSKIYITQLYNLEGGYRVEFIRYSHYGEQLEVPSNDDESKFKIFTSFSYDGHNYTLLGFSEKNNASVTPEDATSECKLPSGTKAVQDITVTSDKAYFATFCMKMPEGTVEVSTKEALIEKLDDPKVNSIYIKKDTIIDLTDQESLDIGRKVTIVGRNSASTIKAKKIKVTADEVFMQRLTLDIAAEAGTDSLIEITNSDSDANKVKFTLWQSTVKNSGSKQVDNAIKYTNTTEVIADVRWSKFEAANITDSYINIDGPLGEGTDIYGNDFPKLTTGAKKKSAIVIKSFNETAKADEDEASDVRMDGNSFNPADYAVKLLSSASASQADISFQYSSVKVNEEKIVNVVVEYTADKNNFEGITFRTKGNNAVKVYYLDGDEEKAEISSGTGIKLEAV